MNSTLIADGAAFTGLLVFSAWVRQHFKHHGYSATGAGGIVMSTGIFTAFALAPLPFHTPFLERLITLEILVVWLFLAGSFLAAATRRHFRMHYAHPLRRFAMGTWVAATAVLATLVSRALPGATWLGDVLALLALALYIPGVLLFLHGHLRLWQQPLAQNANGIVLLPAVATQAVIIALHATVGIAAPLAMAGILFGVAWLCSGVLLIALHYHNAGSWTLAIEWKNANCIVHGAVSITGLALVLTTPLGTPLLTRVWWLALVLFIAIETIEFLRLLQRERERGLRPGVLVYDVTQWTRNFTFGMFYAFSFELHQQLAGHGLRLSLLDAVVHWGQYAVLVLLLIEITLFLRARLYRYRPAAHRTG